MKTASGLLIVLSLAVLVQAGRAWGYDFTTLDHPLAVNGTFPLGVDDGRVVGFYRDSGSVAHGFVYNGVSYSSPEPPWATSAVAYDVWGNKIVGAYSDAVATHGFRSEERRVGKECRSRWSPYH